jgi:predicted ATPase/class 3 adenylate cyclase
LPRAFGRVLEAVTGRRGADLLSPGAWGYGMAELPTGTVTFLFSDVVGSTRLWEEHAEAMKEALTRHDVLLRDAVEAHGGRVVKTTGDGLHAVFETAHAAAVAAMVAQRALIGQRWGATGPLRVRIGLHTGEAEPRAGDYYGPVLNRAARLTAAAHGGQILVSQATEAVLRDHLGENLSLVDLGEHRLRDLWRPEHIFQLRAPGLAEDFPPLQSLEMLSGNLPLQVTSFVGRGEELAGIAGLLGESRLVTLTGVGGVGKTRLALQVAAQVFPSYPDGAWFCELAAANDGVALVEVVAAALGVSSRAGVSLAGRVREFLRAKQVLVVLDNCEHLLGAAAEFADALLRECAGVRILATSREGLGIAGERVWPLRSLPVPRASAGLEAIVASDAVRLFAERAQSARSGFVIDATNAGTVAEICLRLDGVPLALELAAARVVALSPADILGRFEERFRLLSGGRRTAVERHQTLRATVDWSYELLARTERRVFNRLGVFAGSFDAPAAEAIAAGDGIAAWDVLDAVMSLVAKSMVALEETSEGGVRYGLLETLRQYARERLDEAGDTDTWRRRHATHYAAVAETIGPALEGPDEAIWHHKLRAELDNLRAAVTWALDAASDEDAELGVRIIAALLNSVLGDLALGVSGWGEAALPRVEATTAGRRAAVLTAAALNAGARSDFDTMRTLALAALGDGLPADTPSPAYAYLALSSSYGFSGDLDRALVVIGDGQAALDASDADDFNHFVLHAAAANYAGVQGDRGRARAETDQCVELSRRTGNPSALSASLYLLGRASWSDNPRAALDALEESVAISRTGVQRGTLGDALALIAKLRAQAHEAPEALTALRAALVHGHDFGQQGWLVTVLDRGIQVLGDLGYWEPTAVLGGMVLDGPLGQLSLLPLHEHQARSEALERARQELGDHRYFAAHTRGATMTYDEIIKYTLAELDRLVHEPGFRRGNKL